MIDPTSDMILLFEKMLLERAMQGFRPILYISSNTDLHCSVTMLLPPKQEQQMVALPRQHTLRAHC